MAYPFIPAKDVSYGGTRALKDIYYIVIHYTGNDGDIAFNNCNFFKNTNTRSAGAHFFVDRSGSVYQSIELSRIAWSVGGFFTQKNGAGAYYKKCLNANSVSIELCDVKSKYPSKEQVAAVKKLISYIQSLCKNAKTIIRHWDVNGKSCPARMVGTDNAEWKRFKAEITGGDVGASKTSKPAATNDKKIEEDGLWGCDTTRAAQAVFHTTIDGIVSRQILKYHDKYLPNCLTSSWQFYETRSRYSGGSELIRVIQAKTGADPDGLMGPASVKALQRFLDCADDGICGPKTVTAFQEYLNSKL